MKARGASRVNSHVALGNAPGMFGGGVPMIQGVNGMIPYTPNSGNNETPGYNPREFEGGGNTIDQNAPWRNAPNAAQLNEMAGLSPTYSADQAGQQAAIQLIGNNVARSGAFKGMDDWKNAFASGNPIEAMQTALQSTYGPLHVGKTANETDRTFYDANNKALGGNVNPLTAFEYGLTPEQYTKMTGNSTDNWMNNGIAGANYNAMVNPNIDTKNAQSNMQNQFNVNNAVNGLWNPIKTQPVGDVSILPQLGAGLFSKR